MGVAWSERANADAFLGLTGGGTATTGPIQGDCFKPVDTPGEAYETEIETLSLEPQPDGTYRGTTTRTIQANECGTQGNVHVVPFVVWRTGPVPPGVVADPPTMSALPQPTSAQQTPGPTPGR